MLSQKPHQVKRLKERGKAKKEDSQQKDLWREGKDGSEVAVKCCGKGSRLQVNSPEADKGKKVETCKGGARKKRSGAERRGQFISQEQKKI